MRPATRHTLLLCFVVILGLTTATSRKSSAQRVKPNGSVVPSCTPAPPGMLSWWPGEGNGNDIRGENNGALGGDANATAMGEVGKAFSFSGAGKVEVPDSPSLNPQKLTVDAWVFPTVVDGANDIIVNKENTTSVVQYEMSIRGTFPFPGSIPLGNLAVYVGGISGLPNEEGGWVDGGGQVPLNTWTHVAMTFDGSSLTAYINGVPTRTITGLTGNVVVTTGPFRIGARNPSSGFADDPFNGSIDEAELFNRALSQSEIQNIFNAGSAGKCKPRCTQPPSGLVSWWTGDDNPFDIFGTNHGTLQNGATFGNGKVGRAFSFDGVDDQVVVPHNVNQNTGSQITIDAWVNPTSSGHGLSILQKRSSANVGGYTFETTHSPAGPANGLQFAIWVGGSIRLLQTPANVLTNGVWQYVAATYDGTTMRIYVNGVEQSNMSVSGAIDSVTDPIVIGRNVVVTSAAWQGSLDEIELFSRALSASEIQAINNAGFAGKCKPCITPPQNMAGWWAGDANANDSSGAGNNGTLQNGAGFAIGKVGQAFNLDGVDDFVQIPDSPSLNPTGPFSVDVWLKANPAQTSPQSLIVDKSHGWTDGTGWAMQTNTGGTVAFFYGTGGGVSDFHGVSTLTSVLDNQWHHVAGVYTGSEFQIYLDGNLQNTLVFSTPIVNNNREVHIGQSWGGGTPTRFFRGLIDEVEYLNAALTQTEIQSLVAAGPSGKCKRVTTAAGANVSNQVGDTTLTFGNVSNGGTSTYQTLDTYQAGPMPFGFNSPLHVADISTNATFTGGVRVCFNLQAPEFTAAPFTQLRVLHQEGNLLVNRTSFSSPTTRTLCADVSSLSLFVISQNPTLPTAAPATISGSITAADGSPLAGVSVNLGGARAARTITDSNGNYYFNNVDTDQFYTVTPSLVNYHFSPAERSFSLLGNKTDAVFTATRDAAIIGSAIDSPDYFVRQHYLDFLGREPDESGFNFWSDQITSCGSDAGCLEVKRINVSAAYFLSIEFQQTGGLVDSLYRISYGRRPLYAEFMPDTARVAQNVIVGRSDWQQQLAANKQAFIEAFVQRAAFRNAYDNLGNTQYVDELIAHTGISFARSERDELVNGLANSTLTRSAVLQRIAEDERFVSAKRNEMFVMMEYFGYLRRDPDDSGYQFWLNKLNEFHGNFEQAEMVKAFIISSEYRTRFPR